MRVVELTAWQVRIPLRKPIRHASFTRTETDNVVIRARLADGTTGFGEGVPREYVTGETIDSALQLLLSSDLAGQLDDVSSFTDSVALVERLRLAEAALDLTRQSYRTRGITNDLTIAHKLKKQGVSYGRYRHWVFDRDDEKCHVCAGVIARIDVSGRGLYWCEHCQKR